MTTIEAFNTELNSRGTVASEYAGCWAEYVAIGVDDAYQLHHFKLEAASKKLVCTTWHQKDGGKHRVDGPAVEYAHGTQWFQEVWLDGRLYQRLNPGGNIQVLRHLDDADNPFKNIQAPMDRDDYDGQF